MDEPTAAGAPTEVADRVWVTADPTTDVNSTVVGGERGLLVVDPPGSEQAARLADLIGSLGDGRVVAIVNTHGHPRHAGGNATLRAVWPEAEVHAHEAAVLDPAADHTFSSVAVVDLGGRVVELVHPGRGHTDGDLVVLVPDAGVLVAGDLVAESAPPAYGPDSWPLEWPAALDFVVGLLADATVVVPGHGAVVDKGFVQEQRTDLAAVAEAIGDLAARSVPVEQALAAVDWPFPAEAVRGAVERGYAHLPRTARRLPLV